MLTLAQILAAPSPRLVLPGAHGEVAERYRHEAMHAAARLRIFAELLDGDLRERPDDDRRADETLREIAVSLRTCADWIDAFRATRIIAGEA